MGDTNINYLDKNNHNDIKDIFMLNGYKQLVTKATRITEDSKTLTDTIFTNIPKNISKANTVSTSLSDHDMVGCVRKLNHLKYESKTIHCRNYRDYDPKALQEDLQEQSWVTYYSIKEPNSAWIYLKSILTHLFDKHAPQIEKKAKSVVNTSNKRLMNERYIQLREAKRANKESDWSDYKRRKNACTNAIRSAKSCYHKDLINENVNNPRQFWKNIKEEIPKNGSKITSSVPFIKDYSASDNDESQQKSKPDIFCTFFSSAANNLKRKTIKLCNFTWRKLKSNPIRTTAKFNFRLVNKTIKLCNFTWRKLRSNPIWTTSKFKFWLVNKRIKLCNFTWRKLKSNPIRTTSKFKFRLVNKTIKLRNFTWRKLKSNPIRTTSKFNFRLVKKTIKLCSFTWRKLKSNPIRTTTKFNFDFWTKRSNFVISHGEKWKVIQYEPRQSLIFDLWTKRSNFVTSHEENWEVILYEPPQSLIFDLWKRRSNFVVSHGENWKVILYEPPQNLISTFEQNDQTL